MMQGDAHLRHHGQWRTIYGRVYTAAALAALATNQMEDEASGSSVLLKLAPKKSPSVLGEMYVLKKRLVNPGVKCRLLSESFKNLSEYFKYSRTSEDDPGLCASNPEARSKYLKYPSRMRKLPLATVTLVCWSQRCFALLAAQPDLPSSTSAS